MPLTRPSSLSYTWWLKRSYQIICLINLHTHVCSALQRSKWFLAWAHITPNVSVHAEPILGVFFPIPNLTDFLLILQVSPRPNQIPFFHSNSCKHEHFFKYCCSCCGFYILFCQFNVCSLCMWNSIACWKLFWLCSYFIANLKHGT